MSGFLWIWLVISILTGQAVWGDSVEGVGSRLRRPVAVRGGVLLLPLGAEKPGRNWPQTLTLQFENGEKIKGQVVWIERASPRRVRHWTDDPRNLRVRLIQREDDSSRQGAGRPFLLASLSQEGGGLLMLGDQVLSPIWRTLQQGPLIPHPEIPSIPAESMLHRTRADDHPDPDSPFEYWRWVLLADRQGLRPPRAEYDGAIESMLARHYADLWRVGGSRLAQGNPGVAAQCRDMLTEVCWDGKHSLACWQSVPEHTADLLRILLDFDRNADRLAEDALAWADGSETLLAWPEGERSEEIDLILVNADSRSKTVVFSWNAEDELDTAIAPGTTDTPIPTAVRVPARLFQAVPLFRPTTGSGPQVVRLTVGALHRLFAIDASARAAVPPGLFFPPFAPPVTLGEIAQRRQEAIDPAVRTNFHLRRRDHRWEAFFECFFDPDKEKDDAIDEAGVDQYRKAEDIRGIEAVILEIEVQREGMKRRVTLAIPQHGAYRLYDGFDDGTLEVHRNEQPYGDRWYCRVVLPEGWLSHDPLLPTQFRAWRTHRGSDQVEYGPRATAPWRKNPIYAAVDLTLWEDAPVSRTDQN